MSKTYFISGHLDLTPEEFQEHYAPSIDAAIKEGALFVVGDAKGADALAKQQLDPICRRVTVYHMFDNPRYCGFNYATVGGYQTDEERDAAMTAVSNADIAWVRPGRENSGTAKNIQRRAKYSQVPEEFAWMTVGAKCWYSPEPEQKYFSTIIGAPRLALIYDIERKDCTHAWGVELSSLGPCRCIMTVDCKTITKREG